jgi:hypothetical protein
LRHTAPNPGALLASLGADASFVLLFDAVTLAPHSRMDLSDATIANLAFSPDRCLLHFPTHEDSCGRTSQVNSRTHVPQKLNRLNFSIYQSGNDFKCPFLFKPSLKAP